MPTQSYKSYKTVIILGIIGLLITGGIIVAFTDFYQILLQLGYYDKKITILNTADIHGNIIFDNPAAGYWTPEKIEITMGLPLVGHLAETIRVKEPDAILLDSGDIFHGTNEAKINQGEAMVRIANAIGYQALTPGNHDFNYGFSRLRQIADELSFPVLSSNIYLDGKPAFTDYTIIEVQNKKIGLFGLTTQDAVYHVNNIDAAGLEIKEPVTEAKRIMALLAPQTDMVVMLSHIGMDLDKQVVDSVPGIDLILCGHAHLLTKNPIMYKGTALVEAGDFTACLGVAEIYFRKGDVGTIRWKTISSKDEQAASKETRAIAQDYHAIALKEREIIIGENKTFLDGIRSHIRGEETNLGDLLADVMRLEAGADIALMNGGGIRKSIPVGMVDLYTIGEILPFINSLVSVEMSGKDIWSALEVGLSRYMMPSANGAFLQVSGIKYVYDGSKSAGKRVVSVTLENGSALDLDAMYNVATNDYLYNGGDGYNEFKRGKLLQRGILLKDLLISYISKKKVIDIKIDKRISVINKRY